MDMFAKDNKKNKNTSVMTYVYYIILFMQVVGDILYLAPDIVSTKYLHNNKYDFSMF